MSEFDKFQLAIQATCIARRSRVIWAAVSISTVDSINYTPLLIVRNADRFSRLKVCFLKHKKIFSRRSARVARGHAGRENKRVIYRSKRGSGIVSSGIIDFGFLAVNRVNKVVYIVYLINHVLRKFVGRIVIFILESRNRFVILESLSCKIFVNNLYFILYFIFKMSF